MKAVQFSKYGSSDTLQYVDIEKPIPSDDQVLVKIHAVSINPLDWHIMRGSPLPVRMGNGFIKPKTPIILGADIAGRVEAIGANVTEFKVGDEVFGGSGINGFAEYLVIKENGLTHKPAHITFQEASAIPTVAFTALQALRAGNLQAGQKILVNGASGGVGTIAIQIAKAIGAEITGVCSARNIDLVCSLGANHVIDYTKQDYTKTGQQYDMILDTINNLSISARRRVLKPSGSCVVVGFGSLIKMIKVALLGKRGDKKVSFILANRAKEDLLIIREMLEAGTVKPVIDRYYSFNQIPEAIRYLETERARGKIIINI